MAVRNRGGLAKEQFWRGMLRRWLSSGQTIRAFCAKQRLSEPSFYAWRRILAARDAARAIPVAEPQTDDLPAFVPIHVVSAATPKPPLEVVLGPGRLIRVPSDFDAATLRKVLAVLEEATRC